MAWHVLEMALADGDWRAAAFVADQMRRGCHPAPLAGPGRPRRPGPRRRRQPRQARPPAPRPPLRSRRRRPRPRDRPAGGRMVWARGRNYLHPLLPGERTAGVRRAGAEPLPSTALSSLAFRSIFLYTNSASRRPGPAAPSRCRPGSAPAPPSAPKPPRRPARPPARLGARTVTAVGHPVDRLLIRRPPGRSGLRPGARTPCRAVSAASAPRLDPGCGGGRVQDRGGAVRGGGRVIGSDVSSRK